MSAPAKLAWFLFAKMDSIPVGKLTPSKLQGIIEEFWEIPSEDVLRYLIEEYSEDDLPECLKASSC